MLIATLFAGQHTSSITSSWTGLTMIRDKVHSFSLPPHGFTPICDDTLDHCWRLQSTSGDVFMNLLRSCALGSKGPSCELALCTA